MTSFLRNAFVGAVLALTSLQSATAQQITMTDDGSVSLNRVCADLSTEEKRKLCQSALEFFAITLRESLIAKAKESHYESYGLADDPIIRLVERPTKKSYQIIGPLDKHCNNIASENPKSQDSKRLVDGSIKNTSLVAQRARTCAEMAVWASEVTHATHSLRYDDHQRSQRGY